jgi:hypothetical protein
MRLRCMVRHVAGAAVALLALAGTAGCGSASDVGAGEKRSAAQSAQATSALPPTYERDGTTLYLHGSDTLEAAFVDDPAAPVLRVAAGMDTTFSRGVTDCAPLSVAAVEGETDTAVTVVVGRYGPSAQVADPLVCNDIGGAPFQLEVELSRPLGTRSVLDATSGAVPVHTSDQLPPPAIVPLGYTGGQLQADEDGTLARTWGTQDDQRLLLSRRPAGTVSDRQEVLLTTTVHGQPAVATKDNGFADLLCLRWDDAGTPSTGVWLCSSGSPAAPLSAEELLEVAESMPRLQDPPPKATG